MQPESLLRLLCAGSVIPAVRNIEDFKYALEKTVAPTVILLFGDILILPSLLAQAQSHKKRLLVHLDLLDGIGKDEAGIRYLARLGVNGLITTKAYLCKTAREEGMIAVQRLFLMDSEALRTGINLAKKYKPDAVEVLPAAVPASAVAQLKAGTGLPILAGGLVHTHEDVEGAIKNGICAISASQTSLWN